MKLITWNVNGIRSVFQKTFLSWLKTENPDIVCLQEIKADSNELSEEFTQIDGYHAYFHSAKRKGYAGVAVYSKIKPISVETKLGIERFDDEGRCLKLTFKDFTLFNFYLPNGARDQSDMGYKLGVYEKLFPLFQAHKDKPTILTGDFNIAHTAQDVFYAKQNEKNTMFTPAERRELDRIVSLGYVDTFRSKYPDKKSYSWWSYAHDARNRDIGWRIDYFFVSPSLASSIQETTTHREILGSDHGPCCLVLDKKVPKNVGPIHPKKSAQSSLF